MIPVEYYQSITCALADIWCIIYITSGNNKLWKSKKAEYTSHTHVELNVSSWYSGHINNKLTNCVWSCNKLSRLKTWTIYFYLPFVGDLPSNPSSWLALRFSYFEKNKIEQRYYAIMYCDDCVNNLYF